MKKYRLMFLTSLTIVGALLFALPTNIVARTRGERHPQIHKALNALERARVDLQDARHDYCGHRAEALEATNQAIAQLRQALQFDRASIESLNTDSPSRLTNASYRPTRLDRYPNIHNAMSALEHAKEELQHAAHDFGGHRVEAIRACDAALAQLRQAVMCANDRREDRRERRT